MRSEKKLLAAIGVVACICMFVPLAGAAQQPKASVNPIDAPTPPSTSTAAAMIDNAAQGGAIGLATTAMERPVREPIAPGAPRGGGACANCDAGGICDLQLGLQGTIDQLCNDGQWVSLAFPFQTGGAAVSAITMVNNTNTAGGDLYLMADAPGDCAGPDVNNILVTLCDALTGQPTGVENIYAFAPVVPPTELVWVVAVFRSNFSFDVAFNNATLGTPQSGYANLTGGPDPAQWEDLIDYGYGACYCVHLTTGSTGVCGNGDCEPGENCTNCPGDCGECQPAACCYWDENNFVYVCNEVIESACDALSLPGFPSTWFDGLHCGDILCGVGACCMEPTGGCPGDSNGDGVVNALDVACFIEHMTGVWAPGQNCGPYYFNSDMDGDGMVELADVDPFVTALLSGVCSITRCLPAQTEYECLQVYPWGTSWHEGLACEEAPCTGACCLQESGCAEVTEYECLVMAGTWTGQGVSCADEPCCPTGTVPENEPQCFDEYVDTVNGGCFSEPPVFGVANCNETVCGTTGTFLLAGVTYRDTDWFEFTVTDWSTVILTLEGDFPQQLFLLAKGCPATILLEATGNGTMPAVIDAGCLEPDTYVAWVGPSDFTGVECGTQYLLSIDCVPCAAPTGACCVEMQCVADGIPESECAGNWYEGQTCATFTCPDPSLCADLCEDAVVVPMLPATPIVYAGHNLCATSNDCPSFPSADGTSWIAWEQTECMDVHLSYCGSQGVWLNAWLQIANGCPCDDTTANADFAFSCVDGNVQMDWTGLPAGIYYYPVMRDAALGSEGDYQITVTGSPCIPPPENDRCEDAILVDIPSLTAGDTSAATLYPIYEDCGTTITAPGIWYSVIGAGNTITATTCTPDGFFTYDTKLTVYCMCSNEAWACIEGNDDGCTVPPGGIDVLSTVSWCSEVGHEYKILVHGFSESTGEFHLQVTDDGVACGDPPGCADPIGACCVELVCVGDMVESECTGDWFDGETCAAGFQCPIPPEGDVCATAFVVPGLPYDVLGSTVGMVNDYNEECPWTGSEAADVVYSYTPTTDEQVTISLCNDGTDYDTKLYVYENTCLTGPALACNDDACYSPQYQSDPYVSRIDCLQLYAGNTYYIVVDGFLEYEGGFRLSIESCEPCMVACTPNEGEGPCFDEYVDNFNAGCNATPAVFQPIACGQTICGESGTFFRAGVSYRDTDWFEIVATTATTFTWSCEAEFPVRIFIIDGNPGCGDEIILESISAASCTPVSLTASVGPGTYWFWVGPSVITGVPCGAKYEATLTCQ